MMKNKKILSVILAAAFTATFFAGCSSNKAADADATVTATEIVTDKNGETVTDKDGEAVTEVVTVAAKDSSSTTSTTTTTTTAVSGNNKTTTKSSTTGNGKTTKKPSTSKPKSSNSGTTAPVDNSIGIVLKKNGKASCSSPNVTLASGEVTIEKGGDYKITSETNDWHGQIIIKLKNTEKADIRFENVKISNNTKNVIRIIDASITSNRSFLEAEAMAGTEADDEIKAVSDNDKAPNVSLSFPTGTSSSFTTSANSYTGVIYNESKLTIKGNGKATIESTRNANNCICSTKSITVKNVSLTLTTEANNSSSSLAKTSGSAKGIFTYSKVYLESGNLTIKSNGDGIRCDSFYATGGTANIKSSACDGIDADDAIVIDGGSVTSVALEKSSFKVRRVNNTENGKNNGIRSGKGDTFEINGGTVVGESKKISTVQSSSKQASVTCRAVKSSKGTDEAANESKVAVKFKIGTINKSSSNKCIKYLYSSGKVSKGEEYKITADGKSVDTKWQWNKTVGSASVVSSTKK